jgi:hypothetical protein
MTDLLKKAIEAVSTLPHEDQNRIAVLMMEAVASTAPDEGDWEWVGGKKPDPEEVKKAVDGLREFRKRLSLGGLKIRDLIEEGRR